MAGLASGLRSSTNANHPPLRTQLTEFEERCTKPPLALSWEECPARGLQHRRHLALWREGRVQAEQGTEEYPRGGIVGWGKTKRWDGHAAVHAAVGRARCSPRGRVRRSLHGRRRPFPTTAAFIDTKFCTVSHVLQVGSIAAAPVGCLLGHRLGCHISNILLADHPAFLGSPRGRRPCRRTRLPPDIEKPEKVGSPSDMQH